MFRWKCPLCHERLWWLVKSCRPCQMKLMALMALDLVHAPPLRVEIERMLGREPVTGAN